MRIINVLKHIFFILTLSVATYANPEPELPALHLAARTGDIGQIDAIFGRIHKRIIKPQEHIDQKLDRIRGEMQDVIREGVRGGRAAATAHLVRKAADLIVKWGPDKISFDVEFSGFTKTAAEEAFNEGQAEVLDAVLKDCTDPYLFNKLLDTDHVREVAFNATLDPEKFLPIFKLALKYGGLVPWNWIASQHGSIELVQASLDYVSEIIRGDVHNYRLPRNLVEIHRQVTRMHAAAAHEDFSEFDDAWDTLNAITLVPAQADGFARGVPDSYKYSPVMFLGNTTAERLAQKSEEASSSNKFALHVRERMKAIADRTAAVHRFQMEFPGLRQAFVTSAQGYYANLEAMEEAWNRIKELGIAAVGESKVSLIFPAQMLVSATSPDELWSKDGAKLAFELAARDCPEVKTLVESRDWYELDWHQE